MPGPKLTTKPRVAVPTSPELTGLDVPPGGDAAEAFRELPIEQMAPGESPEEVIARQESESMHMAFMLQREAMSQYWAPRMGMTRLEYEREMRLNPDGMQQRMMEVFQDEEDRRDSGLASDQTDSMGYERLSAASMYNAYAAGSLQGTERVAQLARSLVPKELMGRFTPMLDRPRPDGFITGWSFVPNGAVPENRRHKGRRFFTEVDPNQVRFVPEPTLKCEMRGPTGEPCEKWLYTPDQLDIHQQYKHNREWAQGREARQQAEARSVAEAQIEAAKAQRETAESMRVLAAEMAAARQGQAPAPEAEKEEANA